MPDETELPPGYPVEWEADVVLSDGKTARLRPITPTDRDRLVAFYARVSPESKFLRFFAPYPVLSQRDLDRFTKLDYVDRVALIITIGERMVAVGRYDRVENDEAEVAFLVEDSQQGRGVGQLLLEHLAEAARERGITRFVAEVLPQNNKMVQVFAEAGFKVARQFEDGVVVVEFPILPTDTSVGVMERREHRAESSSIRYLVTPRNVVALGSADRIQPYLDSLLRDGFTGRVTAVSTDQLPVSGVPQVGSLTQLEGEVDLVIVDVPATELADVVIDAAHRGARGLLVLSGEEPGEAEAQHLVGLARSYGLRALGPDALGLVNTAPDVAMNASPAPALRTGHVGIFCQSAAVGVLLWSAALGSQVGVSQFISTGGFADVTGNDVMQFWEDDDATRACLLSLDRIGNPRKFTRIIRRLAMRKPVVIFNPTRAQLPDRDQRRPVAPPEAVSALFRQSGVMVAERRKVMFDIAEILTRQPLPRGPRVQVVSNSATISTQVIGALRHHGLVPVAPLVTSREGSLIEMARQALAGPDADSVLCVSVGTSTHDQTRDALSALAATSNKPLLGVFIDFASVTARPPAAAGEDEPGGLPVFDGYGDAVPALSAVTAYAHWLDRDRGAVPDLELDLATARGVVTDALRRRPEGGRMDDAETTAFLRSLGVKVVPRYRVGSLAEAKTRAAELGWNVVLKATASAVRGRPDLASVYRDLNTETELDDAWRDLGRLVQSLGLGGAQDQAVAEPVVQAMVPTGVSLLLRSVEDPAFGPVVSLGLAGVTSELFGDLVHRVPPVTDTDAAAMVRELRSAPLLFGRHGSQGVNVEAVESLIARIAQMADLFPELGEVVLTPCVATGRDVSILGARIELLPGVGRRDAQARVLG